MSESARKKQRVNNRDSGSSESADPTLHGALQQLSHIIPKPTTPFRRAQSVGATPGSRRTPTIQIRTPGTAARTPRGLSTRQVPARRVAPTTPHAIRALRERAHAARTPGRRRSGRIQRETPRDTLRALSRALARDTKPSEPSPEVQALPPRNPALDNLDVEDGPDPARPRLSMALEDLYEDDSFHEAPPRQSLLPDLPEDADTATIQSLEFGRRAYSEDPRAMFTGRLSERFGDLHELGIHEEEFEVDGVFLNRRPTLDPDQILQQVIEEDMGDTEEIRALTGRRGGRPSDVDLGVFGRSDEPDEPTFRFTIPQRIRAADREEEPEEMPIEEDEYEDLERGEIAGTYIDEDAGADLDPTKIATDDEEAAGAYGIAGWESDHGAGDDPELEAYREEVSAVDRSLLIESPERPSTNEKRPGRKRKELNISRSGHEYPSFPSTTLKKLATGLCKSQGGSTRMKKDTLAALGQATDWFFERVGQDLAAYAQHAGRKAIEDADMITLMKRQRLITKNTTVFSRAQKVLPRELLQELRMQPPPKIKRQKRKRMDTIAEDEDEDG